jgi:hypothetical protein
MLGIKRKLHRNRGKTQNRERTALTLKTERAPDSSRVARRTLSVIFELKSETVVLVVIVRVPLPAWHERAGQFLLCRRLSLPGDTPHRLQ